MQKINALNLGLALGAVVGLWHVCWAVLVALGWAQALIDFILWMHFINPVLHVGPFVPGTAAILIVVTSATGFVAGYLLATAWNWLHRGPAAGAAAPKEAPGS
jgi:hypothetical protein